MAGTLILILHTDSDQTEKLTAFLSGHSFQVKTATDGMEGMALWQMVRPDLVISAMDLPKADGLDILDFRNMSFEHVPLIFLMDSSVPDYEGKGAMAIRQGAYNVIDSAGDSTQLLDTIRRALLARYDQDLVSELDEAHADGIIGSSPFMQTLRQDLELIGSSGNDILITGEAGTGKTLLARHVHTLSGRPDCRCIRINCPALSETDLERILLRDDSREISGKLQSNALRLARGGILYLREITALPLSLQEQLFQTLQSGGLETAGPGTDRKTTRIIASSSKKLDVMVKNGLFHADLYSTLKSIHFDLQPLRERGKDLLELIEYFLAHFSAKHDQIAPPFTARALQRFLNYPWPGNIGELRHVVERTLLTCNGSPITEEHLPVKMRRPREKKAKPISLPSLPQEEKLQIIATLEEAGWNQSESARRLGITRNTLRYRMKKYKIKARPRQTSHA